MNFEQKVCDHDRRFASGVQGIRGTARLASTLGPRRCMETQQGESAALQTIGQPVPSALRRCVNALARRAVPGRCRLK